MTQKVWSDPVGSTSTSATASADSGPQAARQGRAAKTFSFGSARRRPHQGLSAVSAQTATPAQDAGVGQRLLRLGDLTQGRGDPEAQAGHLDGAGRVLAAPDGDVEGALGRQAVADQLAPDTHDQAGARPTARRGQQLAQQHCFARGAQAKAPVIARRGLRRFDDAGQARALIDQPEQVGVDGVDPLADLIQGRRGRDLGHFLPQKRRIAT